MITLLLGYNACSSAEMKKETITISSSQLTNGYYYNLGYVPRYIHVLFTASNNSSGCLWSNDNTNTFLAVLDNKLVDGSHYFEHIKTGVKFVNWPTNVEYYTVEILSIK